MEEGIIRVDRAVKDLVSIFDKQHSLGVPAHLPLRFTFEIRGES